MYGSIRKSYGAKKSSRDTEKREKKTLFLKKNKKSNLKNDDFQETSYVNVENSKNVKNTKIDFERRQQNTENNLGKSEFPIASVILTIVFTMMVMVLAFGFGG